MSELMLVGKKNGASEEQLIRYRPRDSHVLLRKLERGRTTSGLYLPREIEKSLLEGVVVLVGPGRLKDEGGRIPVDLKIGDIVIFSEPAGLCLDPESPDIRLVMEDNVIAVKLPVPMEVPAHG